MSLNCRFIRVGQNVARRVNLAATFPRIINGNGAYAGAPAIVQDPQFPMSNALLNGRTGAVWVWPASAGINDGGSDVLLEIDLGSVKAIGAVGVLGVSNLFGTLFPNSLMVECIPGATVYSTTGWVNVLGGLSIGNQNFLRDFGTTIAPQSARYWRFRWVSASISAGFTVASVVLATTVTDLGFLYSGADETRVRPRTLVEGYDRSPSITYTGPEYRRWEARYDNNDAALRAILDDLFGDSQPFVFLTPDNLWQECVWDTEEFTRSHIWAPPDRYQMVAGFRALT